MFDPNNKEHLKLGLELACGRVDNFYNSPLYLNAVSRYETRRDAYYRRHSTKEPIWKSKLFFPVFFLGCKGFEARVKQTIQNPLVKISYKSATPFDPGLRQMERVHNYDLNHDLYISDFERSLFMMYWFNQMFGVSIARESIISEAEAQISMKVNMDRFGNEVFQQQERAYRKEHTKTEVIHPLNFAHGLNRGEFIYSSWASVRYEMSIAELYALRNDEFAVKEDLEYVIAEVERGNMGWNPDKSTFYVDDNVVSGLQSQYQNTIIVDEYSGDMNFKGNYDDNTLYYGIFSKKFNKWLRLGPSKYRRHHYWKMRTYPDPFAPFGVGACDMLLPPNIVKNVLFNQYIDWGNANLKFLYEVYSRNIKGGLTSLISGNPGGMIEAIDESTFSRGPLVRPVQKNNTAIPGIADILNYLEKEEVKAMPSNDMRTKGQNITDTATGVMEVSKREDDNISAIVRDMDHGLCDGMRQKIQNRIDFFFQPGEAMVDRKSPSVRYYPFEMSSQNVDVEISRISPTADANKYLQFLQRVAEGMKMFGIQPNPQQIIQLYAKIGRDVGIDEVDDLLQEMPVQIPGATPSAPMQAPGGAAAPLPAPANPALSEKGASNALALAA